MLDDLKLLDDTPAARGPEQEYKLGLWAVFKIVSPFIVVFLLLLSAAWVVFSGGKTEHKSEFRESFVDIRKAQLLLANDHLTFPKAENALQIYLEVLNKYPKHYSAIKGIELIGDRFIAIIDQFIEREEFNFARLTIAEAYNLSEHMLGSDFNNRLIKARRDLENKEKSVFSERAAQAASNTRPFEAFSVFQDSLKDGGLAPQMMFVPAGLFVMGSNLEDPSRDEDEGPQIEMRIAQFAIGVAEVSFDDFQLFINSTGGALPHDSNWGRKGRPVINLSWLMAKEYALWLSEQTGLRYRLPTEAEWEYVANANSTKAYSSGSCLAPHMANYDDRQLTMEGCLSSKSYIGKTVHVRAYEPSPWGLFQVHGNVREWVEDCWTSNYEGVQESGDAKYLNQSASCGKDGKRVLRGGAWDGSMRSARTANRYAHVETEGGSSFGLRLVRVEEHKY